MKTSTYTSWWREMGAISRGMMFIEGNVATPAALEATTGAGTPRHLPARPRRRAARRSGFSLYEDLLFLGGRPMTAGHNDDIEEPFPQTRAGIDGARRADQRKTRGVLQAVGLAVLALATASAFIGREPSPSLAAPPAVAAKAVAAGTTEQDAIRIVDLPPVIVQAQAEDYALLAADTLRRVDCLGC